jgi:hypothetical protein
METTRNTAAYDMIAKTAAANGWTLTGDHRAPVLVASKDGNFSLVVTMGDREGSAGGYQGYVAGLGTDNASHASLFKGAGRLAKAVAYLEGELTETAVHQGVSQ